MTVARVESAVFREIVCDHADRGFPLYNPSITPIEIRARIDTIMARHSSIQESDMNQRRRRWCLDSTLGVWWF